MKGELRIERRDAGAEALREPLLLLFCDLYLVDLNVRGDGRCSLERVRDQHRESLHSPALDAEVTHAQTRVVLQRKHAVGLGDVRELRGRPRARFEPSDLGGERVDRREQSRDRRERHRREAHQKQSVSSSIRASSSVQNCCSPLHRERLVELRALACVHAEALPEGQVEALRRSVRCGERAHRNGQREAQRGIAPLDRRRFTRVCACVVRW